VYPKQNNLSQSTHRLIVDFCFFVFSATKQQWCHAQKYYVVGLKKFRKSKTINLEAT